MGIKEVVSIGPRHDVVASEAGPRLVYWSRDRSCLEINVGACARDLEHARQSREWGFLCILLQVEPDAIMTFDRGLIVIMRESLRGSAGRWSYRLYEREVDGSLKSHDIPARESIATFVETITGLSIYEVVAGQSEYDSSSFSAGTVPHVLHADD